MQRENIWVHPIEPFGAVLGVADGVPAYSSQYKKLTAPFREQSDDDDLFESHVEAEVVVVVQPQIQVQASGATSLSTQPHITFSHKIHRHSPTCAAVTPKCLISKDGQTMLNCHYSPGHASTPTVCSYRKSFLVYAGAKFQCVEYARRFLTMRFGITFPSVHMAYHILTSMRHFTAMTFDVRSTLTTSGIAAASSSSPSAELDIEPHYHNTPAVKCVNGGIPDSDETTALLQRIGTLHDPHFPVVGSLIIWSPTSFFKHTGHVAVAVAVDEATGLVQIAEQNVTDRKWPSAANFARTLQATRNVHDPVCPITLTERHVSGTIWGWVTPLSLLAVPSSARR